MKTLLRSLLLVFVLTSFSFAQGRPSDLGVGVMFGQPTGLTAKNWFTNTEALQIGVAWSLGANGHLNLQGDYLWHKYDLFKVSKGELPVYYGVGARMALQSNATVLGIRVPIGVAYEVPKNPLDIFFELGPSFSLTPATTFYMTGGAGVRFYFGKTR